MNPAKARVRVMLGGLTGFSIALLFCTGILDSLENFALDHVMKLRRVPPISDEVRLVGIGDRDVGSRMGQWPFPRAVHSDVLSILSAMGARHITFDVLFTEKSVEPAQDEKFKADLEKYRHTTLAYHFDEIGVTSADGGHFVEGARYGLDLSRHEFIPGRQPVPPYDRLDTTYGAVNAVPDTDGVIRRVPLYFEHGGKLHPSLAMQTVISALGLHPDQISITPGREITLVGTPRGTLRIPVDEHGQYRVNYLGDISVFTPAFQYMDLYESVESPELGARVAATLKDRIAIIGIVSQGNTDVVNTPLGRIPGVGVQATVVSNILTGSHLYSPPFWTVILLATAFGALFAWLFIPKHPWPGFVLFAVVVTAWCLLVVFAAGLGRIVPLMPVLITAGAITLLLTAVGVSSVQGDHSRILSVLGRYFARPHFQRLIETADSAPATGERREVTIFFSDIRGFTSWTERAEPDEVTKRLNEYFSAMTPIVEKHGGTLDKFIGDCIMVFFSAPVIQDDHPLRAVRMACEMRREMAVLNARWEKEGHSPLHTGVGIHTGYVTVGNFGSPAFLDYTVIGRAVNLAARIESKAGEGMILISTRTHALVRDHVRAARHADLVLKGIPEPQEVWEVLD